MGAFDDLIPAGETAKGRFDDLIPSMKTEGGTFDDLIPKETVSEGPVMGTLKAIPRVVTHTAASMAQMPVSGLAALAKLITSRGDIQAANRVLEENQNILNEAYLTTPEEVAASENINLAMKPFQMAGEGLQEIVRLTPAKDTILEPIAGTLGEAAAMFGAGGAGKAIKGRLSPYPISMESMKPVDTPTLRPAAVPAEAMTTEGVLVGKPFIRSKPALRPLELAGEAPKALPYPDYAGEGFTFKEGVTAPDLLRRDGKPFQSEAGAKAAITREGLTGYEAVKVEDGYVARAVEVKGKEFRPEDAPKKYVLDAQGNIVEKGDYVLDFLNEEAALKEISSFLDEVKQGKPAPADVTGELPGISARETFSLVNPETEIFQGDISKKNMTPTGEIPGTGKLIGSERGSMPLSPESEIYRGASELKKKIENLPEGFKATIGPKGVIRKTAQGFSEELNSPEVVLGRDPKGAEIYKTLDRADQAKNSFLSTEGQAFTQALGNIKADSEAAARVGQVLDGKMKPSELNPSERHLHDFLKERFDFLIHKAARSFAGSEEAYLKVVNLSQEAHPRQMKLDDLVPERKVQYDRLTAELQKVRNGKKLDDLTPAEKEGYFEIRQKQRDLLHEEFLKTLPEGERQAYDLLKRQIKNYLPHILDPEILLTDFKQEAAHISERLKTATDPGTITKDKQRLRELETAIVKLQKGEFVTYESLPKNVRFRFFETRKGKAGYSFDAVKAYQAYLNGIARKIFDEPAVKRSADLYGDLDPSLKDYTKWYLRRYMGWEKSKLDPLASAIASFQWIRTLGFNPRSALTNLTQRLNTVAELPLKHSIIGEKMAFTKEGEALFDKTGIAKEVPHVLMEGVGPESLERIRTIAGYMFNKVELGNRKHAFLSAYSYIKEKTPGITESAAIDYATDIVHKTQFRYGRVGMPKIMTSPLGRVGLQYWSYPIKQIEMMAGWARREPMKLIKFLAIAEGTSYTLKEFLDTDLSNAIGIGVNWAEALEAVKDLSEADIRGMYRHSRLAVTGGGGILPSGPGPTLSSAIKIADKIGEGKGFEQFKKEISPVVWRRFSQAYDAVKGERNHLYPIKNDSGEIMYFLKGRQLIQRTIGPMTATEKEAYLDSRREALLEQERIGVLHEISAAIVDGNQEKAKALVGKYQIVPSDQMIENEALERITTRRERHGNVGVKEQYQFQREGRLVRPGGLK